MAVVAIDGVASRGFGGVKRCVGAGEEKLRIVAFRNRGDAGADRLRRGTSDERPHPLGEHRSTRQFGGGQDNDELFTTTARDDVRIAGLLIEQRRNLLEQPIAIYGAVLLVEGVEVIEIKDGNGKHHSVALMHRQKIVECFVQRLAIAQAGERVAPLAGKRHQAAALLAYAIIGVGELHREVLCWFEQSFGFLAEALPIGGAMRYSASPYVQGAPTQIW